MNPRPLQHYVVEGTLTIKKKVRFNVPAFTEDQALDEAEEVVKEIDIDLSDAEYDLDFIQIKDCVKY